VLSSRGAALLKLDFLEPRHFHGKENRLVFESSRAIWEQGGKPDYVTVAEYTGLPREAVNYYREFDEGLDNVEEYGRLIVSKWMSRELIATAERVAEQAASTDPITVLDGLERSVVQLRPQRGNGFTRVDTLTAELTEDYKPPLPTGFSYLDSILRGLRPDRLITLGARPSIGKSTLALNIAANVARAGRSVALYSLEMSSDELAEKLVLSEAGVDQDLIEENRLGESDIDRIGRAFMAMGNWKLWLDDTPGLGLMELSTRAKRLKVEHGLDLLIVDYLQLIRPPKAESRVVEVSIISRELKVLAKTLGIPILVLSQLSRAAEIGDGEPELWQLRESGSIEQDSDQVILLWRDREDPSAAPGGTVVYTNGKVAKNRKGRVGHFRLALLGAQSKFMEG